MPTSAWFRASNSRARVAVKWEKSLNTFWFIDRAARLSMGNKLSILPYFDSTMSSLSSKSHFGHIEEETEGKMHKGRKSLAQPSLFWGNTLQTEVAGCLSFFSPALFWCTARHSFLLCGPPSSSDISLTKAFAISAGVCLVEDMFRMTTIEEELKLMNLYIKQQG